jgi:hypothetical protein
MLYRIQRRVAMILFSAYKVSTLGVPDAPGSVVPTANRGRVTRVTSAQVPIVYLKKGVLRCRMQGRRQRRIAEQTNGYYSNAGIAQSCVQPGHVGYLYPGSDSTKATSPEQSHSSSASIHSSGWLRSDCRDVFLFFCAYLNRLHPCENTGNVEETHSCRPIFVPIRRAGNV